MVSDKKDNSEGGYTRRDFFKVTAGAFAGGKLIGLPSESNAMDSQQTIPNTGNQNAMDLQQTIPNIGNHFSFSIKYFGILDKNKESLRNTPLSFLSLDEKIIHYLELHNHDFLANFRVDAHMFYGEWDIPDRVTLFDGNLFMGEAIITTKHSIIEDIFYNNGKVIYTVTRSDPFLSFCKKDSDGRSQDFNIRSKSIFIDEYPQVTYDNGKLTIDAKVKTAKQDNQSDLEFGVRGALFLGYDRVTYGDIKDRWISLQDNKIYKFEDGENEINLQYSKDIGAISDKMKFGLPVRLMLDANLFNTVKLFNTLDKISARIDAGYVIKRNEYLATNKKPKIKASPQDLQERYLMGDNIYLHPNSNEHSIIRFIPKNSQIEHKLGKNGYQRIDF